MSKKRTPLFKKWISALRSGKYKQTRVGELQYHGRYCCLGVACKVSGEFEKMRSEEELSYFGLKTIGISNSMQCKLMEMNDYDNMTFKEIADWAEKNA